MWLVVTTLDSTDVERLHRTELVQQVGGGHIPALERLLHEGAHPACYVTTTSPPLVPLLLHEGTHPACYVTTTSPPLVPPGIWHPVGPHHISAPLKEFAVSLRGASPFISGPQHLLRRGHQNKHRPPAWQLHVTAENKLGSCDGRTEVRSGRPEMPDGEKLYRPNPEH